MKKVYYLAILLITVLIYSESEAACNDGMRCCSSDWEIGLDFLIWKPCVDDLNVCGTSNFEEVDEVETYNVTFKEICPGWEGGLRFWFRYPDLFRWSNMGFKASYTFLDYTEKGIDFGENQTCLLIPPDISGGLLENISLDSRYESLYHELDGLFYFDCTCGDCHALEPYFGLAFLYIEQKLNLDFELTEDDLAATADMRWRTEAGGVGFRFGMAYHYYYSRCLSYYAFGQGTILASQQEERQQHSFRGESDVDLNIINKECWGCISGFHIGTGMIYDFCVCDFDLSFRIGYEFRKWFGLRKHRRFFGDNIETEIDQTSDNTRSIGVHGLNFGFGWCF